MQETHSVVSRKMAKQIPYPFVYVGANGLVFELDGEEKNFLEEQFLPNDSARPYVKSRFWQSDGFGNIAGFCPRKRIPNGKLILPSPTENREDLSLVERTIIQAKAGGAKITENEDGSHTMVFPKLKRFNFFRFWKRELSW